MAITIRTEGADELLAMLGELAALAETSERTVELADRLFDLTDTVDHTSWIRVSQFDRVTAGGAVETTIRLEPSDRLRSLVAALRAWDVDGSTHAQALRRDGITA